MTPSPKTPKSLDSISRAEKAVIRAAKAWWKARFPGFYTLEDRVNCPTIYTHTELEDSIARCLACLIKAERAAKKAKGRTKKARGK